MPELPEVETTRRGLQPYLEGACIKAVSVREARLRWPVDTAALQALCGHHCLAVHRRGKYLLLQIQDAPAQLVHLGMSGSLRLALPAAALKAHDHLLLTLDNGWQLRFHDPRRFGCWLSVSGDPYQHALLATLGPEPLSGEFSGETLFQRSRGRRTPVKSLIMDSHVVVGVGNIYAAEALFLSGIHPLRACGRISLERYQLLAEAIRHTLAAAIDSGGTTLRDFINGKGEPGYFQQQLNVYGREGEACRRCAGVLRLARLSNRATVYCPGCQR